MVEQLMYSSFNTALLTVQECHDAFKSEITAFGIFCIIGIIIIALISFYHIYKSTQLKNFIKEKKLEKHFQEWKQDNKGL